MRTIGVLCVTATVVLFEISSGARVADPLEGKSAISTEYKARFHKIHPNGINSSEGYIAGVHNMERNTDEETWTSFAAKCAEVIKGIVSALTGAVSSEPGDRTDLHLDFKNRIYHHDNRRSNDSDLDSLAEEYVDLEEIANEDQLSNKLGGSQYPSTPSPYEYGARSPMDTYQTRPDGSYQESSGEMTQPSPDPTWNTPATKEVAYTPTEQYQRRNPEDFPKTSPFPSNLPQDNWKPTQGGGGNIPPDGLTTSSRLLPSPKAYTTPFPELPAGRSPPESASQVAQNPPVDSFEDGVSSEKAQNLPDGFGSEEESVTPYPDLSIMDATQVAPVETPYVPPNNFKAPDYQNPSYKFLATTTPPPPNPALYIPITKAQTESMTEGPGESDDSCCDEDTYDDETPTHKVICKTACRDLEEARNELKDIFDRIKKRLKCSRRLTY